MNGSVPGLRGRVSLRIPSATIVLNEEPFPGYTLRALHSFWNGPGAPTWRAHSETSRRHPLRVLHGTGRRRPSEDP